MKNKLYIPLLLFVLCFEVMYATTYYVATNGNNSNSGTLALPWKTINYGAGKLSAGDVLYIRGGIYSESVGIWNSGTSVAPIVISAYQAEVPIIDGTNVTANAWTSIFNIGGNYVQVSGLEVRNANWQHAMGVVIDGHHNKIGHMKIHDIQETGVAAHGDYSVVEYCSVWQAAKLNCRAAGCPASPYPNGGWATGISAMRDKVNGITDNAILRGNIVYNNWGEGLSAFEANGTIMEDNIVYDNWATNTYISDASNVVFRRNMVYTTPGSIVGVQSALFTLADEVASKPRSDNNKVHNNFFYGSDVSLFSWTIVSGSGLTNTLFANNTLVNSKIKTGTINSGSRILNNIVENASGVVSVPSKSGLTFSNNLWSVPPPANAVGTGDKTGNPNLAKTGPVTSGGLTSNYFKINGSSMAVDGATVLSEVTTDFFSTLRGAKPDIGGHEYSISTAITQNERSYTISVFPNPFNTNVTLKISSEIIINDAVMKIYDICGKEVKVVLINSNETIIDRGELQSGIYFYTIINNPDSHRDESIAKGKLVVQ